MAAVSSQWFWSPKKQSMSLFPFFPHLFAMKWWNQMPWSSFFECGVLSQLFHFPLSLSSRGSLVTLHFLPLVKYAGWQYSTLTYSFPNLEPVYCFISSSNCCFLEGKLWQASVQFSHSVLSDPLWPHGLQHTRPPCPSPANSWSLLKFMCIELVMPSNHLILCHPILLLPSVFSTVRVFSNESVLRIR